MANDWRYLGELIWSDQALVQVMVYRILDYLKKNHPWCGEILAGAYVDEEVIHEAHEGFLR